MTIAAGPSIAGSRPPVAATAGMIVIAGTAVVMSVADTAVVMNVADTAVAVKAVMAADTVPAGAAAESASITPANRLRSFDLSNAGSVLRGGPCFFAPDSSAQTKA